jgi:chromosome segregation ATPase
LSDLHWLTNPVSTQQDNTIGCLEVALNEVHQRFIAHSKHLSAERETHQRQLQDAQYELDSARSSLEQQIHDLDFSVKLTQDKLTSTSKSLEDTTERLETTESDLADARHQIGTLTDECAQLQADGKAAREKIKELTSAGADLHSRLEAQERENASLQAHVTEAEALLASANETAGTTEGQLRQQLADAERVTKDLIEQHQVEKGRMAEQYQAKIAKLEAKLRSVANRSNSGNSTLAIPVGARPQTPNSSMGDAETSSGLWNMALSWSRLASSRPPNATRG